MNEETEIIENKKFQLTIAIIIGILFSFSFFSLYNYSSFAPISDKKTV